MRETERERGEKGVIERVGEGGESGKGVSKNKTKIC